MTTWATSEDRKEGLSANASHSLVSKRWEEVGWLIQMGCDSTDLAVRMAALDAALTLITVLPQGTRKAVTT